MITNQDHCTAKGEDSFHENRTKSPFIPCLLENMSRNSTRLMTNLNEWQMMKMRTMMERFVATSRLRRMRLLTTILLLRLANQS